MPPRRQLIPSPPLSTARGDGIPSPHTFIGFSFLWKSRDCASSPPPFSRTIRIFLDVKTLIHPLISRGFQGNDRFAPFSYARARASTERAMSSLRPFGGNALRALPPTFTRKSALRSRARLFLMPALVQARSGHKKTPALLTERGAFARWCRWSDSNRHGFYSTGF